MSKIAVKFFIEKAQKCDYYHSLKSQEDVKSMKWDNSQGV